MDHFAQQPEGPGPAVETQDGLPDFAETQGPPNVVQQPSDESLHNLQSLHGNQSVQKLQSGQGVQPLQGLHDQQQNPCLSVADPDPTPSNANSLTPVVDSHESNTGAAAQEDLSKPWGVSVDTGAANGPSPRIFYDQNMPDDAVNSEKLHQFRTQLHQLSRQKDGLMPKPDGTFPSDWLGLAWDYQALAEHVIRSAWPCSYPEGLLPCVSQQLDYLKKRLEEFPSIPVADKDKFQRLFILAALGIIAKMKLVTFCWTFVELKQNEHRADSRGMNLYLAQMRQSPLKGRRPGGVPIPGFTAAIEDIERTEYTTRSGRKTHRTSMKPEKV